MHVFLVKTYFVTIRFFFKFSSMGFSTERMILQLN